jgi:hypothetical protein
MSDDMRSGLVRRFLARGDKTERPGRIEKGQVGIDLGGGVEIIGTRVNLLRFAREIWERFSRNAFPEGIKDPTIMVVGNPVDGFEYFGPADGNDPDGYLFARQRALEDDSQDYWLAKLQPLESLYPIDGHDDVPARTGTATDLLDEFECTDLDDCAVMDLVQDTADKARSEINQKGRVEQFAYLVGQLGYPAARTALRGLTEELVA